MKWIALIVVILTLFYAGNFLRAATLGVRN
jgi:hypothetical protein